MINRDSNQDSTIPNFADEDCITPTSASASAPGRLDLLGGVIDYSGGTTLEWPLRERTHCRVRRGNQHAEPIWRARSGNRNVGLPSHLLNEVPAEALRTLIPDEQSWARYVFGCAVVLRESRGIELPANLEFEVESDVPEGKGVSSSAALEVSTMLALSRLLRVEFGPVELALLCQRVENVAVGAPCGVMDQIACAYGRANQLLPITCQPAGRLDPVQLPATLGILGIDSGERHSVGASPYGRARTAAFMAKAWLEYRYAGLIPHSNENHAKGQSSSRSREPSSYLVNADYDHFLREAEPALPQHMTGDAFLALGLSLDDPLSRLESHHAFPLRAAARHAIEVHQRVQNFMQMLREESAEPTAARRQMLGKILLAGHEGYSSIGLGSSATDRLQEYGMRTPGMLGGKITGGGSGGTVAFLYEKETIDREALLRNIRAFENETGHSSYLFEGSSDGAVWT